MDLLSLGIVASLLLGLAGKAQNVTAPKAQLAQSAGTPVNVGYTVNQGNLVSWLTNLLTSFATSVDAATIQQGYSTQLGILEQNALSNSQTAQNEANQAQLDLASIENMAPGAFTINGSTAYYKGYAITNL